MKKLFFAAFAIVCLIVLACTKAGTVDDEDLYAVDQDDKILPVITANKPIANQVFVNGDSIVVEGKVTDDKKLFKGKVQIKNDANSVVVADNYYETHFLSVMNFRLAYKSIVTVATDYTILIEFQDHGLNTSTTTIKVKVNP